MNDLLISGRDVYASMLSRKQAMGDGLLIDLQGWSIELGYCIPVACTTEVWREVVPEDKPDSVTSNDRRRTRFLLKVLRFRIRAFAATDRLASLPIALHRPEKGIALLRRSVRPRGSLRARAYHTDAR